MKKNIILILVLFLVSCQSSSKKDEVVPECCSYFGNSAYFNLVNTKNDDLLDSATAGYFPVKSMKLFYMIQGKKVEVYDPLMATPRNINLYKSSMPFTLVIYTSTSQHAVTSNENNIKIGLDTTLLELSTFDTDTIVTQWKLELSNFHNEKVWYNGKLSGANPINNEKTVIVK